MPETDLPETSPSKSALKVFVYGTLKPGESNYASYCEQRVLRQSRAIASGQLFDLPLGYPAMTLSQGTVHGFLLWFHDISALVDLDELEDYNPARPPEENEYERCQIEVFDLEQASLTPAWTYVMSIERIRKFGGIWLPEGYWSHAGIPQPTLQIPSDATLPDWVLEKKAQRSDPYASFMNF